MADVFLSYAREDSETMRRLASTLGATGLSVWTDEGLTPGEPSWQKAIEQAIEVASCLVVILSPSAKESPWVNREIAYAQAQGLRVYPALAGGDGRSSVPIALINAQYVDLRSDFDGALRNLASAIKGRLGGERQLDEEPEPIPDHVRALGETMIDRVRLRSVMSDGFNSNELRALAFDLGLDYDDLAGGGKSAKIIELITYFERRGRYGELVQAARAARPELDW
jgi:hypothetical protein